MESYDASPKEEKVGDGKLLTREEATILVFHDTHKHGRRAMRGWSISALAWFACVIFLFFLSRSSPGKEEGSGMVLGAIGIIAVLYAGFVGPALGILYGFDVVSYLNWREKKRKTDIIWRLSIGFLLLVFATLFYGFGLAGVYFVGRETITNPQLKNILPSLGALLLSLGLVSIGVFLTRRAFRRKEGSTEAQDIAAAEEVKRGWETLDFATLEQQLNCTLPAAYKAMMQPTSEWREKEWMIYPKGLDDDEELHWILGLVPPTPAALRKHPTTGETMLCFASSEVSEYWLRPGDEDPPVYEQFHEGNDEDFEEIAPHLSAFLAWPKEEI